MSSNNNEKFGVIIDAQENASKKIDYLNQRLAALGGPELVKAQKEINKLERNIGMLEKAADGAGKAADKSSVLFSRFTQGIAAGNIIADLAEKAISKIGDAITSTVNAAADSQKVWMQVTAALERHKMMTAENETAIRSFTKHMQTMTGVADEEWQKAIVTMIDRGASLEQAFELVGYAADIATSKNKDMGRTMNMVADAIGKDNVKNWEALGVKVNENASAAAQLDDALGQLQANFGGAATAAAGSFSTQINVAKENLNDMQESIGSLVLPMLTELAHTAAMFFDMVRETLFGEQFGDQAKEMAVPGQGIIDLLKSLQRNMHGWVEIAVGGAKLTVNAFALAIDVMKAIINPFVSLMSAVVLTIKGEFSAAGDELKAAFTSDATELMKETTEDMNDLWEGAKMLASGFVDVAGGADKANAAIDNWGKTANKHKSSFSDIKVSIPKMVPEFDTEEEEAAARREQMMDKADTKLEGIGKHTVQIAKQVDLSLGAMTNRFGAMVGSGVGRMVDGLISGRESMADIFKGMAEDFMVFFIKATLAMILNTLIPGIGGLLGHMFDTPVNDRMAYNQGADFGKWFTRGTLETIAGANLGRGIAQSPTISPVSSSAGMSGGAVVLHVNITGNVLSDKFIEHTVAPKLQKLITQGRSMLSLQKEQITGGRDVRTI